MSLDLNTMDDALLAKYLQGETVPEERDKVEVWLNSEEANQEYFARLTAMWNLDRKLLSAPAPDADLSWKHFEETADARGLFEYRSFPKRRLTGIAAILLIGIGLGWFIWYKTGASQEQRLSSGNKLFADTLQDGTVVALNRNTDMTFSYGRTGKAREVNIEKGESFFSVKADARRAFVVRYRGCEIKVLGTSFNVRTKDRELEVIVASGMVKVVRGGDSVMLQSSEKVLLDVESGKLKKSENKDNLYNYYFTEGINVENTPLWKVAEVISKKYNLKILILTDSLKGRLLTMKMEKDTQPEEMLRLLSTLFDCKVTRVNDQFIIE